MSQIENTIGTAIYLAGHGSKTKPRLIDLQYQRVLRYRRSLLRQDAINVNRAFPAVFIDIRLPAFGMGHVTLNDVPRFVELHREVENRRYDTVFMDVDEIPPRPTPDFESAFIRSLLESAGAKVLNAFTDDKGAFAKELKERCGQNARDDDVTDSSDFVCFFPSLASEIASTAISRELRMLQSDETRRIYDRIEGLKRLRPYSGGGIPFVEGRLHTEWDRLNRKVANKVGLDSPDNTDV
jgi:hypothetical protein